MTKRKQETNKKIAKAANMSLQDKLRTLKIVKVEAMRNRGVNPSQIVTLEDGSRAIYRPASGEVAGRDLVERRRKIRVRNGKMPTTDLEKARRLFEKAGLAFPTIPEVLAARLREQGNWCFSTRELKMSPYNDRYYIGEGDGFSGDYAVLCHSGHGVNSYAIQYYLVYGPLRMFLFLGWGGIYMDAQAAASQIRECFSLADEIVQAAATVKKLKAGKRLTIVASDFYGSYWSISRQSGPREERMISKRPAEILTEVLHWLKSPPKNQI